jgi:chromosome segregation ATPase
VPHPAAVRGREPACARAGARAATPTDTSRPTAGDLGATTTGTTTGTARETSRLRERLTRTQDRLRRVRATERVLVEQVAYLDEMAADAETRKLVAQTPLADREWREARTDLDRHTALLDETRREVAELLAEQDRLLERLFELETLGRDQT